MGSLVTALGSIIILIGMIMNVYESKEFNKKYQKTVYENGEL